MAWYYDRMLASVEAAGLGEWRDDLLSGLTGDVLEIGTGTGANLTHYPATLDRLVLSEPDRFMRAKLEPKLAAAALPFPVEVVDGSADRLPVEDDTFDAVVSTLVLCSVPSVDTTLAEIRRVLKPGGRLTYLEHVAAIENPKRLKWQRRLEPIQKRIADGCHLTRTTDQDILAAGFELVEERRESVRKMPPITRVSVRGHAVLPPP